MKADRTEARASTLYLWYREQPEHSTAMRDHEIALRLHAIAPGEGWAGPHAPSGSAALVRSTRRWIDRQAAGDYADVTFGTKRAGRGRAYSNMYDGREAQELAATVGTQSQIEATEHYTRAEAERRARECMKYRAEARHWFDLRDFAKAMACEACAEDVQTYGYLTPRTIAKLHAAGLRS